MRYQCWKIHVFIRQIRPVLILVFRDKSRFVKELRRENWPGANNHVLGFDPDFILRVLRCSRLSKILDNSGGNSWDAIHDLSFEFFANVLVPQIEPTSWIVIQQVTQYRGGR